MTAKDIYELFKDFKNNDFKHLKRMVYLLLAIVVFLAMNHMTDPSFISKIKWVIAFLF